jgi:hypothetical protein
MGDAYARELTDGRIGALGVVGARHARTNAVWVLLSDMLYCRIGPPGAAVIAWSPEERMAWHAMRRRYEHHLT